MVFYLLALGLDEGGEGFLERVDREGGCRTERSRALAVQLNQKAFQEHALESRGILECPSKFIYTDPDDFLYALS